MWRKLMTGLLTLKWLETGEVSAYWCTFTSLETLCNVEHETFLNLLSLIASKAGERGRHEKRLYVLQLVPYRLPEEDASFLLVFKEFWDRFTRNSALTDRWAFSNWRSATKGNQNALDKLVTKKRYQGKSGRSHDLSIGLRGFQSQRCRVQTS